MCRISGYKTSYDLILKNNILKHIFKIYFLIYFLIYFFKITY